MWNFWFWVLGAISRRKHRHIYILHTMLSKTHKHSQPLSVPYTSMYTVHYRTLSMYISYIHVCALYTTYSAACMYMQYVVRMYIPIAVYRYAHTTVALRAAAAVAAAAQTFKPSHKHALNHARTHFYILNTTHKHTATATHIHTYVGTVLTIVCGSA